MEMLNSSAESGAPWGTPAAMVKSGPVKLWIFILMALSIRKFEMVLTKRGGRFSLVRRRIRPLCQTLSKAPLTSLAMSDTLWLFKDFFLDMNSYESARELVVLRPLAKPNCLGSNRLKKSMWMVKRIFKILPYNLPKKFMREMGL